MYSNSRNDVPRVAQRYGTMAAHTWRRVSVLVMFVVCLREHVLAGDQWWPRTSGGRLRSVRAITYLLRHRIGNFVKGNKKESP